MSAAVLVGAAFLGSLLLTGAVRRYAVRILLDVPNERSSHERPTPRGGGLAIAVAFLGAAAVAGALALVPGSLAWGLAAGGAVVALTGWIDDHRNLSARVRFPVQVAAAAGAVAAVGGLPSLSWGGGAVSLGPGGFVLGVVGVVWSLNLFNFMDGIDGIAAGEALSLGLWGGFLLVAAGDPALAVLAFAAAAAAAGFLPWNWAPARIFMGDVGSSLLGFAVAVLALASENRGAVPLLAWAILYALFIVDATATLVRRALRRERVHEAHRLHAYQRLVRAGWPHGRVSAAVLALNAVLAALAGAAVLHPPFLVLALALALALAGMAYAAVERVAPMYERERGGR